jgi:FtsH-binding integral membrane protein
MEEKPQNRRDRGGQPPHRIAVDGEESPRHEEMLPVWFFVGIILLVYGVITLITGLTELHHPPDTVLAAELHPTIWWGVVILLVGVFFAARHRRRRE